MQNQLYISFSTEYFPWIPLFETGLDSFEIDKDKDEPLNASDLSNENSLSSLDDETEWELEQNQSLKVNQTKATVNSQYLISQKNLNQNFQSKENLSISYKKNNNQITQNNRKRVIKELKNIQKTKINKKTENKKTRITKNSNYNKQEILSRNIKPRKESHLWDIFEREELKKIYRGLGDDEKEEIRNKNNKAFLARKLVDPMNKIFEALGKVLVDEESIKSQFRWNLGTFLTEEVFNE
jgi:hypothetical protein